MRKKRDKFRDLYGINESHVGTVEDRTGIVDITDPEERYTFNYIFIWLLVTALIGSIMGIIAGNYNQIHVWKFVCVGLGLIALSKLAAWFLLTNVWKVTDLLGFSSKEYKVIRDGETMNVKTKDIHIGDLIVLGYNSYRVPADILITRIDLGPKDAEGGIRCFECGVGIEENRVLSPKKHVPQASDISEYEESINSGTITSEGLRYCESILYAWTFISILDEQTRVTGLVIRTGDETTAYGINVKGDGTLRK